ncbi:antitoxin [Modestobacter excelsi]|uniref:antitoxin n=1 Tax=Modestobacter excelsi TaxID=2213161 RepID=UPI001FE86E3C|nr:antitoxin [Modestobacter excelsi]
MATVSRAAGATGPEGELAVGMMDKAKDALNSDKGEQVSDKGLDKAGQIADQKTGGTHDAQIDKGRDLADGKLGTE